jgi:hypothetical protein
MYIYIYIYIPGIGLRDEEDVVEARNPVNRLLRPCIYIYICIYIYKYITHIYVIRPV